MVPCHWPEPFNKDVRIGRLPRLRECLSLTSARQSGAFRGDWWPRCVRRVRVGSVAPDRYGTYQSISACAAATSNIYEKGMRHKPDATYMRTLSGRGAAP